MDEEFCREQAQRIRALAERADPFIKRRLLALVNRYDAKAVPLRASNSERSLPARTTPPIAVLTRPDGGLSEYSNLSPNSETRRPPS
jgi:hypothetical protein